jgi:hypothetical protein
MKTVITLLLLFFSVQTFAQRDGRKQRNRDRIEQRRNNQYGDPGVVYAGTVLQQGKHYYSENGKYYFTFQNDGNLAVYKAQRNTVIWSSGTNDRDVTHAEFQRDGNLVLTARNGQVIWDSFRNHFFKTGQAVESERTRRNRGSNNALVMQSDGNLVIYGGAGRNIKWASGSDQRK